MSPSIAIVGTLDTKADQIEYLKRQIEDRGHKTKVIDVGVLGAVPFNPDISREQVAEAAGMSLKEVLALNDNCLALTKMAQGAAEILRQLHSRGELEGVIALGGSQATSLALRAMKSVPIGVPKVLLTTVAYSQLMTPEMLGGDDLIMIPWTAGLYGLNSMSRWVVESAAGVISGTADAYGRKIPGGKSIVGVTSLGGSISRYMHNLKPALEERGYEVAVFHVTGMSGRMYERAVEDGLIAASLDLAAGIELLNAVTDGACSAGDHRLEAASKLRIPQIVSPGPIEAFHWGKDRPLPARYENRPRHQHSELILTVRSSVEEIAAAARLMAEKLNAATGPAAVVLPMRGMIGSGNSAPPDEPLEGVAKFRRELMSITLPGMKAFRKSLMQYIKPEIRLLTLDAGFNDPLYAATVLELFDEMMRRRLTD
jgi:uncharacterized protein (UPF0261 family)